MKATNQTTFRKYCKFSFGLATLVLVCLGTAVAQTTYTVTDLGTLGGTLSIAYSVNNKGWLEGFSTLPGDTAVHAFLWRNGVMTDLGTLGGPNSYVVFSIKDDKGLVTGFAETSATDPLGEDFCLDGTHLVCLPFLWRDGVMTPLSTLGGNNGYALGVNNRGQVVGIAETSIQDPSCIPPQSLDWRGVIWGPAVGEIHELPPLPGDSLGGPTAINNSGQAVGASAGVCGPPVQTDAREPVLWQDGSVTDLGNLGGAFFNIALGINDRGQIVGHSDLPGDTAGHAFLWQNGVMTDLGTLPSDVNSSTRGINSAGQVVGESCNADFSVCRAFLWQDGVMTDLNTLIPAGSPVFLLFGSDINSGGQIAGIALVISTGEIHAFLANPSNGEAASESAAPAARGETTQRPNITLPENARKLLEQRLRFSRFGAPLTRWR
jgi:probable HAF family extracellular repeat protein